MSNQQIHCSVSYCRYNERGEDCSLDHIVVQPQMTAEPAMMTQITQTVFETSCGSYDPK
ncbi:MAG: DUF1540 domain-containing protein [Sulfobacillus sp.]